MDWRQLVCKCRLGDRELGSRFKNKTKIIPFPICVHEKTVFEKVNNKEKAKKKPPFVNCGVETLSCAVYHSGAKKMMNGDGSCQSIQCDRIGRLV